MPVAWSVMSTVLAGRSSFGKYAALIHVGSGMRSQHRASIAAPPPAMRALLGWQHATRIEFMCVNAVQHVMLAGMPADLHAGHDEVRHRRYGGRAH